MSEDNRPKSKEMIRALIDNGFSELSAARVVANLWESFPDWFAPESTRAPEPDPLEEFLTQFCAVCDYIVPCNAGIPFENRVYRDCQLCRDALRAYVADLRKQIESLQKAQQLKGGER